MKVMRFRWVGSGPARATSPPDGRSPSGCRPPVSGPLLVLGPPLGPADGGPLSVHTLPECGGVSASSDPPVHQILSTSPPVGLLDHHLWKKGLRRPGGAFRRFCSARRLLVRQARTWEPPCSPFLVCSSSVGRSVPNLRQKGLGRPGGAVARSGPPIPVRQSSSGSPVPVPSQMSSQSVR